MANKHSKLNQSEKTLSPRTLIKKHLLKWNSVITKSLNIYLSNYQTETAIFIARKHEKTIIVVVLVFTNFSFILNFWPAIL